MKAEITRERQFLHHPAPMMTLAVEISPAPPTAALESAIKATVEHHPLLGCKAVQATGGNAYLMTTEEPGYSVYATDLEGDEDWQLVTLDAQNIPFDMEHGELVRFGILEGSDSSVLVIHLHRIVGDSSCLAVIARDVIAALNEPGSLGEPLSYKAPEPVEGKVPMMTRTMCKMMNKRWNQLGKAFRAEDYLLLCDSYHERGAEIVEHTFSAEQTLALDAFAKQHGEHLGSLVTAALVLAQDSSGEAGYARGVRGDSSDIFDFERTATFRFDLANLTDIGGCTGQIAATVQKRFTSEDERREQLAFMQTLEPTLIDAAYYAAFAGYGDLMAGQARDMFGLVGGRAFNLTDLGAVEPGGERFKAVEAHFLPQLASTANISAGMLIHGGCLTVSAQFPTAENFKPQGDTFYDAMARLSELAEQA